MHGFATGAAGDVGLMGTEPPLSPETIGRAPSNYDAPVKLVPLEELVGLKTVSAPAPAPVPVAQLDRRRLVVRLLGGEEVEVGTFDGKVEAIEGARELVSQLSSAEESGRWPEVAGRHLRPASIISVDVDVVDAG